MENELIATLVETFKQETDKLKEKYDGVKDFDIKEYYIKNNPENGYHSVDAIFKFRDYELKFVYNINVGILLTKSTLEIKFMFDNSKLPVEYSIYDLFNFIDNNNFNCYTIPYITDKEKMINAIQYLSNAFEQYKPAIEELAQDDDKMEMLQLNVRSQVATMLKDDVFKSRDVFYLTRMLELYYIADTARFVTDNYFCVLIGNYNKAIKKYDKLAEKGALSFYEKRLLEHLKGGKTIENALPEDLKTLEQAKKLKKGGIKELLATYISWIVFTPIWFVLYFILFKLASMLITRNAIYVGGQYAFVVLLPAFITAIANSYFTRKKFYKILYRKNYQAISNLDDIQTTKKGNDIMYKLFQFVIAMSVVFTLLMANTNISFYENEFVDNLDMFNLTGRHIEYSMIDKVYKVNKFVNEAGAVVNEKTYIIELNDKTSINLYYDLEYEEIENKIIHILKQKEVEIVELDLFDPENKNDI